MLSYVVLRCVMLCYGMYVMVGYLCMHACNVMLCNVMLCYVVLCYGMLWHVCYGRLFMHACMRACM